MPDITPVQETRCKVGLDISFVSVVSPVQVSRCSSGVEFATVLYSSFLTQKTQCGVWLELGYGLTTFEQKTECQVNFDLGTFGIPPLNQKTQCGAGVEFVSKPFGFQQTKCFANLEIDFQYKPVWQKSISSLPDEKPKWSKQ